MADSVYLTNPFGGGGGSGGITIGTSTITGGTTTRILYDNAGVVGEYTLTGTGTVAVMATAPSLTGPVILTSAVGSSALTVTGGTQTDSFPPLVITQTWNDAADTFDLVDWQITSTASATASRAMRIRVGGTDILSLRKDGRLTIGENLIAANVQLNASGSVAADFYFNQANTFALRMNTAHRVEQRGGTNAQTYQLFNTYTSGANFEAATWNWASNVLHFGTITTGGTARVMQLDYGGTTTSAISIPITSGDITLGGSVFPTGYKSADGSAGVSAGPFTAITGITVKNGIITAITGS